MAAVPKETLIVVFNEKSAGRSGAFLDAGAQNIIECRDQAVFRLLSSGKYSDLLKIKKLSVDEEKGRLDAVSEFEHIWSVMKYLEYWLPLLENPPLFEKFTSDIPGWVITGNRVVFLTPSKICGVYKVSATLVEVLRMAAPVLRRGDAEYYVSNHELFKVLAKHILMGKKYSALEVIELQKMLCEGRPDDAYEFVLSKDFD